MKKIFTLLLWLLLVNTALAQGTVPKAAEEMAREMDKQLETIVKQDQISKADITLALTVPVLLSDFSQTSQLARQMSEEVAKKLVEYGYQILEIRKGSELIIQDNKGEFLLTRDVKKLQENDVNSVAIVTGTYTVSEKSVRFNLRILHTPNNKVLAMSSATVPMSSEIKGLLGEHNQDPLGPMVKTKL